MLSRTEAGYDFVAGADPYSDGVVAQSGFEIVHVTLRSPLPWEAGFAAVDSYLQSVGRPMNSLCGVELRCPQPHSFMGFDRFNARYGEVLAGYGLLVGDRNPLARTNVTPVPDPPLETTMRAFSHTVESSSTEPTFVTAGAGELRNDELEESAIVARGDTSPEGMRSKASHVMATMSGRLEALGVGWEQATTTDVYMVANPTEVLAEVVQPGMGAASLNGIHWFPSSPPVSELAFEMDVRGVRQERNVRVDDA